MEHQRIKVYNVYINDNGGLPLPLTFLKAVQFCLLCLCKTHRCQVSVCRTIENLLSTVIFEPLCIALSDNWVDS